MNNLPHQQQQLQHQQFNKPSSSSSTPVALVIVFFIVLALLASPLYTSDDIPLLIASQAVRGVSLVTVLVPLILLLAVQIMSLPRRPPAPPSNTVPFSEVGGSPFGIAFMLLFILAVIWWQPALM